MSSTISFRIGAKADSHAICDIVNRAYRNNHDPSQWTSETDLVAGLRVTEEHIRQLCMEPDSVFILACKGKDVIATVHLQRQQFDVHIGMFAVDPLLQGEGIGKRLLQYAENYITDVMRGTRVVMSVISQRPELIAYYERRGYHRVGDVSDYPVHLDVGTPKVSGLTVESLVKRLSA